MFKETIIPHHSEVVIKLPDEYVEKEIEITVYLKEKKLKYDRYFGVLNNDHIDDEMNKLREEWDRDF